MKYILPFQERINWLGREASHVNFAIMARIQGPLSVDGIEDALLHLKALHPILAIQLVDDGKGAVSLTDEDMQAFPLQLLPNCLDPDWVKVAERELDLPFSYRRGPLARFFIFQRPELWDLLVVLDHGISDGFSAIYLIRDLLYLLSGAKRNPNALPIPPDIWSLVPDSYSTRLSVKMKQLLFRKVFERFIHFKGFRQGISNNHPLSFSPGQKNRSLLTNCSLSESNNNIIHRSLTISQTTVLVDRCRKEGTTVQAALCSAWLESLSFCENMTKSKVHKISIPVNLRSYLPLEYQQTAGLYISTVTIPVVFSPKKNFWVTARKIKEELSRVTSDENIWMGPLVMKTMFGILAGTGHEHLINEFINSRVDYDFSITNLGRIDIPSEYGPYQIKALYGPIVNAFDKEKTVGICTINNQMHITFTFPKTQMAPIQSGQIIDQSMKILQRAVDTAG